MFGKKRIIIKLTEDELYQSSKELVILSQRASATFIQRIFKVTYSQASKVIDRLEDDNIISPANGCRPRKVLVSWEDWED